MNWPLEKAVEKHAARLPTADVGKPADEKSDAVLVNGCLRLEVSAEALLRLLASGQLCVADFRCLDCESKQCVWRLLLMSCEKTLNAGTGCNGRCNECGGSRGGESEIPVMPPKGSLSAASSPDRIARHQVSFNAQTKGEK